MMIPSYNTVLFYDIYETKEEFVDDYKNSSLYNDEADDVLFKTYALLIGKYGTTPIASRSLDQFRAQLHSIMFQHTSNWNKKLEIQKQLKSLKLDELKSGTRAIYNHAFNPGSDPSTSKLEELNYIDAQNTTNYQLPTIDVIGKQFSLIDENLTEEYLRYFKPLFKMVVAPDITDIYTDGGFDLC